MSKDRAQESYLIVGTRYESSVTFSFRSVAGRQEASAYLYALAPRPSGKYTMLILTNQMTSKLARFLDAFFDLLSILLAREQRACVLLKTNK